MCCRDHWQAPSTLGLTFVNISLSLTSLYVADVMIQRIIFLFLPVVKLLILSATFDLPEFNESQKVK